MWEACSANQEKAEQRSYLTNMSGHEAADFQLVTYLFSLYKDQKIGKNKFKIAEYKQNKEPHGNFEPLRITLMGFQCLMLDAALSRY